jgi:hypothetical protein
MLSVVIAIPGICVPPGYPHQPGDCFTLLAMTAYPTLFVNIKEAAGDRVLERISLPIVNTPLHPPLIGGNLKRERQRPRRFRKLSEPRMMSKNTLSPVYLQGNGEKVRSQK